MRKAPPLFVTEMLEGKDGFWFFVGARFRCFGTMSTSNIDWWFRELRLSEGESFFLTPIQDTLL